MYRSNDIPVMIFLPILLGGVIGYFVGLILRKSMDTKMNLVVLLFGITVIVGIGVYLNKEILKGIILNYMFLGIAYSGVLANMIEEEKLQLLLQAYNPILAVSLLISIVDLGAPLDYHLILGAGFYTFVYIVARALGKNGGARLGATIMHMPETVKKYLWLNASAPFRCFFSLHIDCLYYSTKSILSCTYCSRNNCSSCCY